MVRDLGEEIRMAELGPESKTLGFREADLVLQLESVLALHEVERSLGDSGHVQARGQDIIQHAIDQHVLGERVGDPRKDGELRLLQH